MRKQKFDYDDYVKEREQLVKYEQANYDNYERTILTLSASFLAFSVAFLGLFKKKTELGGESLILISPEILIWSWVFFASSVFCMLFCFFIGALAFRKETRKLEEALEDVKALEGANIWDTLVYLLYILSGATFILGIIFLVNFCAKNIRIL